VPHLVVYTTGPLVRQYLLTFRTISKLTLPDRFLTANSDDAPETASENQFRNVDAHYVSGEDNGETRRRGLVICDAGPTDSGPIKVLAAQRIFSGIEFSA
jgi:hypothetical protein